MRVEGLGFRVWDLRLTVKGSGCMVYGSGCRVQGLRFRVKGLRFRDQGAWVRI